MGAKNSMQIFNIVVEEQKHVAKTSPVRGAEAK
jgi:hypothetical protein